MKKFFNEFKTFISRGNVMDMAIGVVIATAFGKISASLVADIIMPLIGCLIGGVDLATLNITLKPAVMDGETVVSEAVVLGLGTFLTTIIDFILIAFVVFLVVKAMNVAKAKLEKPAEPEPEKEPEPTKEEVLLHRDPRSAQEQVSRKSMARRIFAARLFLFPGKCNIMSITMQSRGCMRCCRRALRHGCGIFWVRNTMRFLSAFDRPLCTGLRKNPLKTGFTGDLSRFALSPVPWCPTGFYYDAAARPGLSPLHAAGLYYLQEPSAMAPAEILGTAAGRSRARPLRRARREIHAVGRQAVWTRDSSSATR